MTKSDQDDKSAVHSPAPKAGDFIPEPSAEMIASNRAVDEQTRQLQNLAATDPVTMGRLLRGWLSQGNDDPLEEDDSAEPLKPE